MPRPRKPQRDETEPRDTPFRHVLIDFMWNRRAPLEPPMTQGQLAIRLGLPRTTIASWLTGKITPPMDLVFDVLARLDIPLQRLNDEYHALSLPVPPLLAEDTGPTPRAYEPPPAATAAAASARPTQADEWGEMVNRVAAEAREIGMDPDTIAALVEHISDRQANRRPYQANIAAEHSLLAPTPTHDDPTQPKSATSPGQASERNAPRRRSASDSHPRTPSPAQ